MSNKSAIAEARRLLDDAQVLVTVRRRLLNSLLPELPADLTFDVDAGDDPIETQCPGQDGKPCGSWLAGIGYTDEVSPVLGWDTTTISYNPRTMQRIEPPVEVTALWFGDYEYGDNSTGIVEIVCGRGHGWRVPENTDRDV